MARRLGAMLGVVIVTTGCGSSAGTSPGDASAPGPDGAAESGEDAQGGSDAASGNDAGHVDASAGSDGATPSDAGDGGPSVGPVATSAFITADFGNATSPAGVANAIVEPQLFGISTGGLSNNGFAALSSATTRGLVKALNVPLFRLNANFANPQTAAAVTSLVANATETFPSTCTWVLGVDTASAATAVAGYMKANSPIACKFWEVHNETQPGQSSASYDSDALSIAAAIQAVDPSYRIAGDVSAGLDTGDMHALVEATDASTLGLLDFHDYLYCQGQGTAPTDAEMCLAHRSGATTSAYGQDQQSIQTSMKGTFAASLPVLLGEYNDECSAGTDLRAGTSIGAAFMVSATLSMAAASTQPVWAAVWDIFDDAGANYNLIDEQNNLYPQYYTLQRLIQKMPGRMVNTTEGTAAAGMQAWATKSGSSFAVAIVNSNTGALSGKVALSHWPVNSSGTTSVTLWTYPQGGNASTPIRNTPGAESTVAVTSGLTASITVPGDSVVILSN